MHEWKREVGLRSVSLGEVRISLFNQRIVVIGLDETMIYSDLIIVILVIILVFFIYLVSNQFLADN